MKREKDKVRQAPLGWRATLALTAALVLVGCATGPQDSGAPAPSSDSPAVASGPQPPQVVNRSTLPNLTLTGVDGYGEYTSLALKISYDIDARGVWQPAADQEPMLNEGHDLANDFRCMAHGAGYNQRTVWFPDTGIFVRGAQLRSLADARGADRPLVVLSEGDNGSLSVAGPKARELEYGYVPCVGRQRVDVGHRASGYVKPGDRLQLRPAGRNARPVTLTVPRTMRPYVILDFAGRPARALVPANMVLLSIDWPNRRAVAQYQVTVAMQPQVARAAWMITLPDPGAVQDRSAVDINREVERYLDTCPSASKPMDPCANPHGQLPPLLRPAPASRSVKDV
ncbi:hypothetical protein FVQ98_08540 [Ottowia sp. GY511]|uniref:Lipoprotein n=1 Tax=Ottowia flava TaxID=2675430 RepID=A0ABW4KPE7_9BURK|nr:hypothetical protein [Ottowia sp. GY511]TXK29559.1 hypothetical protein FVQ98_08540 [Ottowia sp. GY511]